jgi:hypothetical protein
VPCSNWLTSWRTGLSLKEISHYSKKSPCACHPLTATPGYRDVGV